MTKRKSELWSEVDEIIGRGEHPVVSIPAGTEILTPKRRPGRPRVNPPENPFFNWEMQTPSGFPMRCRNPGCNRRLKRRDRAITCSDRCKTELCAYCTTMLSIINGEVDPKDLPPHYRSNRLGGGKKNGKK